MKCKYLREHECTRFVSIDCGEALVEVAHVSQLTRDCYSLQKKHQEKKGECKFYKKITRNTKYKKGAACANGSDWKLPFDHTCETQRSTLGLRRESATSCCRGTTHKSSTLYVLSQPCSGSPQCFHCVLPTNDPHPHKIFVSSRRVVRCGHRKDRDSLGLIVSG
jgi:hypothetical protein